MTRAVCLCGPTISTPPSSEHEPRERNPSEELRGEAKRERELGSKNVVPIRIFVPLHEICTLWCSGACTQTCGVEGQGRDGRREGLRLDDAVSFARKASLAGPGSRGARSIAADEFGLASLNALLR